MRRFQSEILVMTWLWDTTDYTLVRDQSQLAVFHDPCDVITDFWEQQCKETMGSEEV